MRNKLTAYLATVAFAALFLFGCDDTSVNNLIEIPAENVSYSKHIQPVFNLKCTSSGCHEDAARAGGLSLTSYANTTADFRIVVPYNPDNSVLVWAIEDGLSSGPMPPIGALVTPLTDNERIGIRTWIKEGAKAN